MIEIGQDALGRWAFIVRAPDGSVIASDDDYYDGAACMEEALFALKEWKAKNDRGRAAR